MENNAQYMMLNNRLKDSKKSVKKTNKAKSKKVQESKGKRTKMGKSKFFDKYSERIKSIQESDEKQKEKAKKNK